MAQGFLGFGLLRPFRRDFRSGFAAAGGADVIKSAVGLVLGTIGASHFTQGELPWRTDYPEPDFVTRTCAMQRRRGSAVRFRNLSSRGAADCA